MRIFHVALAADWAAAQAAGRYTTSTLGRSLAEEGFIHASRGDQWQGVRERFYADVTEPLVLLNIDTDRLAAPVVEEAAPGTEETFPHIYGVLNVDAVVSVIDLEPVPAGGKEPVAPAPPPATTSAVSSTQGQAMPGGPSFSALFLGEMFFRAVLGSLLIGLCALGTLIGKATGSDWGPIIGAGIGLIIGLVLIQFPLRRRARRFARHTSH